mmetsp:Transcript_795/g.2844  ORF Transcript_795/g.2844 Transcript_795/m.2844 type:complete len:245 (-) Transcript_795:306-1040(-)
MRKAAAVSQAPLYEASSVTTSVAKSTTSDMGTALSGVVPASSSNTSGPSARSRALASSAADVADPGRPTPPTGAAPVVRSARLRRLGSCLPVGSISALAPALSRRGGNHARLREPGRCLCSRRPSRVVGLTARRLTTSSGPATVKRGSRSPYTCPSSCVAWKSSHPASRTAGRSSGGRASRRATSRSGSSPSAASAASSDATTRGDKCVDASERTDWPLLLRIRSRAPRAMSSCTTSSRQRVTA